MNKNKIISNAKLITVQQFACEYGIGINKSYEIVHSEGFPKIKVGRKILIIRDKIDDFFYGQIGVEF